MAAAAIWPWRSATTQCSTRIAGGGPDMGDVAGGEDGGVTGAELGVDHHPLVDREAGS